MKPTAIMAKRHKRNGSAREANSTRCKRKRYTTLAIGSVDCAALGPADAEAVGAAEGGPEGGALGAAVGCLLCGDVVEA